MTDRRNNDVSSLSGAVLHSRRPLRLQRRGVCVRGHRENSCVGLRGRKPFRSDTVLAARRRHNGRAAARRAAGVLFVCGARGTIASRDRRGATVTGLRDPTEADDSRTEPVTPLSHRTTAKDRVFLILTRLFSDTRCSTYKAKVYRTIRAGLESLAAPAGKRMPRECARRCTKPESS